MVAAPCPECVYSGTMLYKPAVKQMQWLAAQTFPIESSIRAWPRSDRSCLCAVLVQMLFGPGTHRLAQMQPAELARLLPHTSLVQLVLLCSEVDGRQQQHAPQQMGADAPLHPELRQWISANARDSDLQVRGSETLRTHAGWAGCC